MKAELRLALERVGWDQLYEAHLPDLGPPNGRGERIARSPFGDLTDRNPSLSVNIHTGLWHCFQSQRGGTYVLFRALLAATEVDPGGRLIPDSVATELQLLEEFQVTQPVDLAWLDACVQLLATDPALLHRVQQVKPWSQPAIRLLNVGYDPDTNRLVFPVYDRGGRLVNARLYLPGGQPKTFWHQAGATANLPWPRQAWDDETVILVEGEPDALTLRCLGLAGASGTMGASQPVPEGLWHRHKHVYVWLDADEAGQQAVDRAVHGLRDLAASVWVVRPEHWLWDGAPPNADVSDLVTHGLAQGWTTESTVQNILQILQRAEPVELPSAQFDQAPLSQAFAQVLATTQVGQRLEFSARVVARGEQRYLVPTHYEIVCPASGHQYCGRCPMRTTHHGRAELHHDPRDPLTLRLFGIDQAAQLAAIKEREGIPPQCPDPRLTATQLVGVEAVALSASILETESAEEVAGAERRRQDAYLLPPPDQLIEEGRDYRLSGFTYPHPKTQRAVLLLDHLTPLQSTADGFTLTPELAEALTVFQPRGDVLQKLLDVVEDLAASTTLIFGRPDLHLAYRTVWHSALRFSLGGQPIERGWLEAIIIGDTRCGKSQTFRRLAQYYQMGLLVDCKMQTPAGILGSVVTSQATGERYVVAGIYPQQDGRVVGFDEFHAPRWGGSSLLEHLASARAEGIVRISKAASAQFHARVRAIWLCNPGQGESLGHLTATGVELLRDLVGQPEDLARFDLAVAVAKDDLPPDVVNRAPTPQEPAYPPYLGRALLLWAHSRRPEQVQFTDEAVQATLNLSQAMYEQYDAGIPLVEPADQRTRVAKVAVSVAAQCFSTGDTTDTMVVRPEHVLTAGRLYQLWYDKPALGYAQYSARARVERTIANEAEVLALLQGMGTQGIALASQLLSLDEFTERSFGTLVPGLGVTNRSVLQTLHANRCVRLAGRGRRDAFQLSPAFVAMLRHLLAAQAPGSTR